MTPTSTIYAPTAVEALAPAIQGRISPLADIKLSLSMNSDALDNGYEFPEESNELIGTPFLGCLALWIGSARMADPRPGPRDGPTRHFGWFRRQHLVVVSLLVFAEFTTAIQR